MKTEDKKLDKKKIEKFLTIFSRLYQNGHITKDEAVIFALMYVKTKQYVKIEDSSKEYPEISDSTIDDFI